MAVDYGTHSFFSFSFYSALCFYELPMFLMNSIPHLSIHSPMMDTEVDHKA